MHAAAGPSTGGTRYAAAEVIDLPFADGTFDVLSSFGITHFQKYDIALFDMLRVMKPGWRLGVSRVVH